VRDREFALLTGERHLRRYWVFGGLFATALAAGITSVGQAWAQSDINGSTDPLNIARFPHAWIVEYESDDEFLTREFAYGRVDKTRRDIRIEKDVRAPATIERATYQIPNGARVGDVVNHYVKLLGAGELFSCAGRDCGRSNDWANYIFKKAILYGPDKKQFYLAAEYEDHLIALYVIERGNKRIYAHLEALKLETNVAVASNLILVEHLAGDGFSVIDGLSPLGNGNLPESARATLRELAEELIIFSGQTVYVVCHLYSSAKTSAIIEAAQRCSEQAVAELTSDGGPKLVPFAAGPLLPRASGTRSRIELVLPHLLDHD
jgi:hypothetical protein